jgi:hypothetical protein
MRPWSRRHDSGKLTGLDLLQSPEPRRTGWRAGGTRLSRNLIGCAHSRLALLLLRRMRLRLALLLSIAVG